MYFKYSKDELEQLKTKDETLSKIIDEFGFIQREINPDIFEALIYQIIGQQISNKAYKTVKAQVKSFLIDITPKNIINADINQLQKCGLSYKKVEYMINIAEFVLDNINDFDNLSNLSNEEIIEKLTKIKGVGIWTVEMLLIFSLNRKDILSYNDLVIKKSLSKLYNIEKLDKKTFNFYKELYSPYGSIAAFYLWHYNNIN